MNFFQGELIVHPFVKNDGEFREKARIYVISGFERSSGYLFVICYHEETYSILAILKIQPAIIKTSSGIELAKV